MKSLFFALALLAVGSVYAAEQQCTLSVENMSCPSCGYILKQTLTDVDGVKAVDIRDDGLIAVVYDDEKTTIATLTEATAKMGYPSSPVE